MAIKGKGKTKARQVARAPKRAPVEVPKPVFRRTWVQIVAAVLLGAFAVMLVVWVTNSLRASSRESDEEAALELRQDALSTIRTQFEAQIGTVGQIQDPLGPVIAPQVREAADALAKGKAPKATTEELEQLSQDLGAAATALDGFDLAGAIRDQGFENAEQTEVLIASRAQLVSALRDVEQAASIVVVALDTDDQAAAEALGASALALVDSADLQAQNAWRTYRNALAEAGLVESLGGVPTAP